MFTLRQLAENGFMILPWRCTASVLLLERLMIEGVEFLFYDGVQFAKGKKPLVPDRRQNKCGNIADRAFHRRLVLGSPYSGRENRRPIVLRHLLICLVQNGLCARVFHNTGF